MAKLFNLLCPLDFAISLKYYELRSLDFLANSELHTIDVNHISVTSHNEFLSIIMSSYQ